MAAALCAGLCSCGRPLECPGRLCAADCTLHAAPCTRPLSASSHLQNSTLPISDWPGAGEGPHQELPEPGHKRQRHSEQRWVLILPCCWKHCCLERCCSMIAAAATATAAAPPPLSLPLLPPLLLPLTAGCCSWLCTPIHTSVGRASSHPGFAALHSLTLVPPLSFCPALAAAHVHGSRAVQRKPRGREGERALWIS